MFYLITRTTFNSQSSCIAAACYIVLFQSVTHLVKKGHSLNFVETGVCVEFRLSVQQ